MRLYTLLLSLALSISALSQNITLINAGQLIKDGIVLYDSGRYEEAIKTYLKVPERDTAYLMMLSELSLAYNSNEQYLEAIEVCKKGLAISPNTYQGYLMKNMAIAYDKSGNLEKSEQVFKQAIENTPYDASLIFNLGITYYNNKRYKEAIDCFFRALKINPYHSGSHLNLGKIAIEQGQKTHAMLSLGMYLAINNRQNNWLVYLEEAASNQIKAEGEIGVHSENAFERMDQIIKAQLANEQEFETKVPINAVLVKQYLFLFQERGMANTTKDDLWLAFYWPIYNDLINENLIDPFLFHILTSTNNSKVKKWADKNEKVLNKFYAVTNNALSNNRRMQKAPKEFGTNELLPAYFNKDHKLESIGLIDASNKKQGMWAYYETSNSSLAAIGNFKDNLKVGVWNYYREDGTISSMENYDNGEIITYYDNGQMRHHYYLKDDEVEGLVEIYNACGSLSEKLNYTMGKREGQGLTYHPNGTISSEYQYENDLVEGPGIVHFANAAVSENTNFKANKLHGPYSGYSPSGTLRFEGDYFEGEVTGQWNYYYSNGKLERTGNYNQGKGTGTWYYYDLEGRKKESRPFKDEGKIHGPDSIFHEGALHYVAHFEDDKLLGLDYFDKSGRVIFSYGDASMSFSGKLHYPNGHVLAEGAYKNGKQDGQWKYYTADGYLFSEYNYAEGNLEGEASEYFKNGRKKFSLNYQTNELHGYYIERYIHGQIKQEGWFQNGLREQQWLHYTTEGVVESDNYYVFGNQHGAWYDYNSNHELMRIDFYKNGNLMDKVYFNCNGDTISQAKKEGAYTTYYTRFKNGKDQVRLEMICGDYSKLQNFYPNGELFFSYNYLSGKAHGDYKSYTPLGVPDVLLSYSDGAENGEWKSYFDNGQLARIGHYMDGERIGPWNHNYFNGSPSLKGSYKNDKLSGSVTLYGPTGIALVELDYWDGDILAYRSLTDANQSQWHTLESNDTIAIYYADGKPAFWETYQNGLLQGKKVIYYPSGKVFSEVNLLDGDYHGTSLYYYPDGKIYSQTEFKWDNRNGKHMVLNPDGTKIVEEEFAYGYRNGSFAYFKNGKKVIEFKFCGNMPLDVE